MSSEQLPVTRSQPVAAEAPRVSRAHRTAWVASTAAVGGAGALVGLLAVPVSEVLGIATASATFTVLGHHLTARTSPRAVRLVRITLTALAGTGGCVSVLGLVRLLGPFGLLLATLLVVTSPAVVHWATNGVRAARSRRFRSAAGQPVPTRSVTLPATVRPLAAHPTEAQPPHGPGPEPEASVAAIRALTDQQLCLAWRISFTALQRSADLDRRSRMVGLRQSYLDELERRNPRGFARWLYAGARPASDPTRYLLAPAPGSSGTMGR